MIASMPTTCSANTRSRGTRHPGWFTSLFTVEGDCVLDPFAGSGTAALAAKRLAETYVGIAIVLQYGTEAEDRLSRGDVGGSSS